MKERAVEGRRQPSQRCTICSNLRSPLGWRPLLNSSNIVALRQPDEIDDPLTNILRAGARQLLAQAVEIEVEAFLATVKDLKLADGRARVVRHGYGPARTIATGIGPVEVARAKIRDRGAADDGERIRFSSAILPLWARRTRSLDALLPVLYLRGISTGDFQEALTALLGKDAPNLSPAVISRLTAEWQGSMNAGRSVICRRDATFMYGPMASSCRPAWKTTANACWC